MTTATDQATDLEARDQSKLIAQLRRSETDLREGEAFSQAIFNAAQTGLLVIDTDLHQIMDANRAAGEILGYPVHDLIGEIVANVFPGACQEEQAALTSGGEIRNQESEMVHRDGRRIPVIRSLVRATPDRPNLVVFSFLDIAARKLAESRLQESNQQLSHANEQLKKHKDQIVQSEKLASIGQLAAGVAHEINNPVGFVTSNLGTIKEYVDVLRNLLELHGRLADLDPADAAARADLCAQIAAIKEQEDLDYVLADLESVLGESMEGVRRVAEIVQNLKSFARDDTKARRPHDINDGIEAMIKMVWNQLKYTCKVERNYGEVPVVQCHPGQINQVIMNILVNASQAMPPAGGTITVGTAVVDGELEISIADTGLGIPAENLKRIFDPFFTTKEVGKGTGLGLSISHGIIQDHGGRIAVTSEVGKGTTFRIFLPLAGVPAEDIIG
jgi:PAS domain S-box-containing protein